MTFSTSKNITYYILFHVSLLQRAFADRIGKMLLYTPEDCELTHWEHIIFETVGHKIMASAAL